MDQYLLFDAHVDEICKKVFGTLIYLNRIKDWFDQNTRITVVKSLALSIINYCSIIWGMTAKHQIDRVQKLQNFAAKIAVGGARKYDHVTPILKELGWMKIHQKICYDICVTVFKALNKKFPQWLLSFPTVNDVQYSRTTRQSNNLFVPRASTNIGTRSIKIKGPLVWNSIPSQLKNAANIHIFKEKIKKDILSS